MTALLAAVAFAAVVLGFLTAVLGLVNGRKIRSTAGKVQEISVNVDGRLSTLIERQAQLLDALHTSGTPIPPVPAPAPMIPSGPEGGIPSPAKQLRDPARHSRRGVHYRLE